MKDQHSSLVFVRSYITIMDTILMNVCDRYSTVKDVKNEQHPYLSPLDVLFFQLVSFGRWTYSFVLLLRPKPGLSNKTKEKKKHIITIK